MPLDFAISKDLRKLLAFGSGVGVEIGATDLEVAVTRGYADRMNEWYNLHAIRPWKWTDATPLDDLLNDPVLEIVGKKLEELVRRAGKKQ